MDVTIKAPNDSDTTFENTDEQVVISPHNLHCHDAGRGYGRPHVGVSTMLRWYDRRIESKWGIDSPVRFYDDDTNVVTDEGAFSRSILNVVLPAVSDLTPTMM